MRKRLITLTCLILLAVAIAGAVVLVRTAPKAERKRPPRMAALVEVQSLVKTNETVVLELAGVVGPDRDVMVRARVAGEVVAMDPGFVDGGLLVKDDEILRIDPADYELALAAARSSLETARFNHKLELGRQDVARREWELLNAAADASEMERELALRLPHLAASRAALAAAQAGVQKASLDLERTSIRAPFNAVVLTRNVNVGSQASPQDVLARLAGTDVYWVTVSIPVDRLGWVTVPGSRAHLVAASGAVREGIVINRLADLEQKGRMARLVVAVDDPLCLKPGNEDLAPLLLGEYVRAAVEGRRLDGVYSMPRKALREDRYVWLARSGKLAIAPVEVLWRDAARVLFRDGISDGDSLIVSDLPIPIQGMAVNVAGQADTMKRQPPPPGKE